MLRGIKRVVGSDQVVAGRFYLATFGHGESFIIQCVSPENPDGELLALYFNRSGEGDLFIGGFPSSEILVELPDISVRVDPPSFSGTPYSASLRPGMLLVEGEDILLTAPTGRTFGWAVVKLNDGSIANSRAYQRWAAFSRWWLVMDDDQGEVEVASFGEAASG